MRSDLETIIWFAKHILPRYQRDWLLKAMDILKLDFQQIGETFPEDILIMVKYPHREIPYNWLGQYQWKCDGDLIHHQILINPSVGGLMALDILIHELVHAVIDGPDHGERFLEVAKAIGLDDTGPCAGAKEVLWERLREIKETLGRYPTVGELV